MIKAIFFDFDGVLTTDPNGAFTVVEFLSKHTGVDTEKIWKCYGSVASVDDMMEGRVSHSDIVQKFSECMGKKVSNKDFYNSFLASPKNREMFHLAKSLKGKYKLAVITDNTKERMQVLSKAWHLKRHFDALIVSAEVGSTKGSKHIFEKALKKVGVKAAETVFIDNSPRNLKVPKKMGMQTIFFDDKKNNVKKLMRELKKLGVDF